MHQIFKYWLNLNYGITNPIEIEMPVGAKILSIQNQNDQIALWAIVNNEAEMETRKFKVVGIGWDLNSPVGLSKGLSVDNYIGTVQIDEFVWHVFEKKE